MSTEVARLTVVRKLTVDKLGNMGRLKASSNPRLLIVSRENFEQRDTRIVDRELNFVLRLPESQFKKDWFKEDITPDGKWFIRVGGSYRKTSSFEIYDMKSGRIKISREYSPLLAQGVYISPNGLYVVFFEQSYVDDSLAICMWEIDDLVAGKIDQPKYVYAKIDNSIHFRLNLAFSPNGEELYIILRDGVYIWHTGVVGRVLKVETRPPIMIEGNGVEKIVYNPKMQKMLLFHEKSYDKLGIDVITKSTLSSDIDAIEVTSIYDIDLLFSPGGSYLIKYGLGNLQIYDSKKLGESKPLYYEGPLKRLLFENHPKRPIVWFNDSELLMTNIEGVYICKIELYQKPILTDAFFNFYNDALYPSDQVVSQRFTLDELKAYAGRVGLPGFQAFDNVVILRTMLMAFRDVNMKKIPDAFVHEKPDIVHRLPIEFQLDEKTLTTMTLAELNQRATDLKVDGYVFADGEPLVYDKKSKEDVIRAILLFMEDTY